MSVIFYASPVWFPSLCYIRKLESFNRKCLKWANGSIPYEDQLFLTKTLPICYHLIFNDVLLFYKMLHDLTELPFSAYFFKVTTRRKSTILCTIRTAKKLQTEKFFFHRVEKSVNEMIRLGVDIFAPLDSFNRRSKELLLEGTVSTFDQLNSCRLKLSTLTCYFCFYFCFNLLFKGSDSFFFCFFFFFFFSLATHALKNYVKSE